MARDRVRPQPPIQPFLQSRYIYDNVRAFMKRAVDPPYPSLILSTDTSWLRHNDNLFLAYTSLIRDVENDILEDDDKAGNSIQCDENWFESMNQAHYALIEKSDNALKSWSLAQSMGRKFNQTHLKKI